MTKYIGKYIETFTKKFIIEANSEEDAQKKLEYVAKHRRHLIDVDHFDHWDVNIERKAKDRDSILFDKLPEE